jgi:cyclopropane-fatty-acyl-phospholipid synthase
VAEGLVTRVFSAADVSIGGDRPWDIQVRDRRFFPSVLTQGSLGFGESYMRGWWRTGDLEEVAYRLCRAGLQRLSRALPGHVVAVLVAMATNRQTPARSTTVVDRHYDLGNDLFFAFLGDVRNYSCGMFDGTDSLAQAQVNKMEAVCRALHLNERDRLIDVGGGWGQFAQYAASRYGCHVTSINISDEQIGYARELCRGLPVDVVRCDYRELRGTYTKAAVIAMLTHVGPKNYRQFMQVLSRTLPPGDRVLIESVGSRWPRMNCEPWTDKYIFPGGVAPALRQIDAAIDGLFTRNQTLEFGRDYVPTLRAWNANLQASWPQLSARYPETIRLMFEYFFLTVAAAFRAGQLKYWHLLLERR